MKMYLSLLCLIVFGCGASTSPATAPSVSVPPEIESAAAKNTVYWQAYIDGWNKSVVSHAKIREQLTEVEAQAKAVTPAEKIPARDALTSLIDLQKTIITSLENIDNSSVSLAKAVTNFTSAPEDLRSSFASSVSVGALLLTTSTTSITTSIDLAVAFQSDVKKQIPSAKMSDHSKLLADIKQIQESTDKIAAEAKKFEK
jgi:hypothetical protein